jgi:hypothetical protein
VKDVWQQFMDRGVPTELVSKLGDSYVALKENFYLGKHKPSELEGGHFAEIVIRVLQWATGGLKAGVPYTPLGTSLPRFDQEVKRLESTPSTTPKSLRVHIPRALLSVYDVRNGRGVGHPSGDVDPNLADATYVATTADWVLAELVRVYHGLPIDQAQALVDGIVERKIPLVQMFGDFPKVLRRDLSNPARALVLLYIRGERGASSDELAKWLRIPSKEARRILRRHDVSTWVHYDGESDQGYITRSGIVEVESRIGPSLLET